MKAGKPARHGRLGDTFAKLRESLADLDHRLEEAERLDDREDTQARQPNDKRRAKKQDSRTRSSEMGGGSSLRDMLYARVSVQNALVLALRKACREVGRWHAEGNSVGHLSPDMIRVMDDGTIQFATDMDSAEPAYRAPECANGATNIRSDVFSLGVILFEILTGSTPPKTAADQPAAIHDAPPAYHDALQKSLSPDPDKRFASAWDLLDALETSGM